MKQFFIFLFCLLTIEQVQSQKDVSVYIFKGLASKPIVKKVGKKPKNAKVGVEVYYITHEVPKRYHTGKFIQFIKYVETYKGKRIREVIYDTGVISGNRAIVDNPTTIDKLNSYESVTNFNKICCVLNTDTYTFSFRKIGGLVLQTNIDKIYPKIGVDGSFYNTISDDDFLNYLKKNDIDGNSIQELISLNKYVKNKFGNKGKREDLAEKLYSENKLLSEKLKKWIPNFKSNSDNNYNLRVFSYENNGIKTYTLHESFEWQRFKNTKTKTYRKIKAQNDRFLIEYPKGHKYEGKVYLKSIDSINKQFSGYGYREVYKASTKNEIPYKKVALRSYEYRVPLEFNKRLKETKVGLEIYGLNGSLKNEFIVDKTKRYQNLSLPINDVLKLKKNESLNAELESLKFLNYYLKTEIPVREKLFYQYQKENEDYVMKEKEFLKKYGGSFHLENLNFKSLIKNIYMGKFNYVDYEFEKNHSILMNRYMYVYANRCSQYLPKNKIKIYEHECSKDLVETDNNGREIRRTCVEFNKKVWKGLYAKPELYAPTNKLPGNVFDSFKVAGNMRIMNRDLNSLISQCGCNSPEIKRFENNMLRYLKKQEPLKLDKNPIKE